MSTTTTFSDGGQIMSAPQVRLDESFSDLLARALAAREMANHPELMLMRETWENGLSRARVEADKLVDYLRKAIEHQQREVRG
jgi:hypothetical protein